MPKKRLSAQEKEKLIGEMTQLLNGKEYVLFAYLFGSFISEKSFNDIDVAIYISNGQTSFPLKAELDLESELEETFHIPVDVRIINKAPASFTYHVIKSGITAVDRDRSLRADFEGLVYKKYFDLQHLTREYLREIIRAPV